MTSQEEQEFRYAAGELLERVLLMADNAGSTEEHRAPNYLADTFIRRFTRKPLRLSARTARSRPWTLSCHPDSNAADSRGDRFVYES